MALKGRALCELGRYAEALAALREAKGREKDDRAMDDPLALYAWARSLTRTTPPDLAGAVLAYGALLPRAATLRVADRSAASLEAGLLTMNEGPPGLDSAVPILREAIRDAEDAAQVISVLALALALDRAGEREESRAVLARDVRKDPRAVVGDARSRDVLADAGSSGEGNALAAMALEERDAKGARELWGKYLEGPGGKGPWAEQARAHQAGAARGPK
jgi:tetratricopeptide (TPR) repeat protein